MNPNRSLAEAHSTRRQLIELRDEALAAGDRYRFETAARQLDMVDERILRLEAACTMCGADADVVTAAGDRRCRLHQPTDGSATLLYELRADVPDVVGCLR